MMVSLCFHEDYVSCLLPYIISLCNILEIHFYLTNCYIFVGVNCLGAVKKVVTTPKQLAPRRLVPYTPGSSTSGMK